MVISKENTLFKTRCKKKVNGNWDIINKNGHRASHTGKPGNFNSLRELI